MTDITPTPKVATGGITGIIVAFVLYELTNRFHINIDSAEASFATVIVSFLSSYLAPKSKPTPEQKADIIQEHLSSQVPEPKPGNQNWNTTP